MRIEQSNPNAYIKYPDRIETYIIRVVNRFFNNAKEDITNTREDIINEAVTRIKKDIEPLIKQIIQEEIANQNK